MNADAVQTHLVRSFDGQELAVHRMGQGRPVLLLHGLFSSAQMNWIRFGHARILADHGCEAIMPDLRAHGASAAPHDPAAYPPELLRHDVAAIVDALGLTDFDLGGFSLGARTAASAVIGGLRPRRLILAGMGLEGLSGWQQRSAFFIDAIDRFETVSRTDPAFMAVQFMKTMKVDRVAARLLLKAVEDIDCAALARIDIPTLVLCGDLDHDNGDPQALADLLPDARLRFVPGTHMSSVTEPVLGAALADFLSG